jgi:hypothetical protein
MLLASSYLGCSALYSKFIKPLTSLTVFIATFSIVMLMILHGSSTIKILIILGINYKLAKINKSGFLERYWPGMVIVGNMLVLFVNEGNDGYRFAQLHRALDLLVSPSSICNANADGQGQEQWFTTTLAYQLQYHHAKNHLFCAGLSFETLE